MTRPFLALTAPLLLASTALSTLIPVTPGIAQTSQADLVRPAGASDLNIHLARLASNPRDVSALIGAGEAAIALDDPRAAAGFFARADAIESGNGRIKAGLGHVMVKLQNPAEALRLFDQATRMGYSDTSFLADRGLARDMTGDQANAQRDYQAALARTPGDAELIRRYAASLGISGQVAASDKILEPLLYKSDRAAWRYRAFILAMNNRQADAKTIADQTFPAALVANLAPYMQKMPYLNGAQKAAAIHFGHFPQTIGTQIAAITPTAPPPGLAAAAPVPMPVQTAAAADTRGQSRSAGARRREREALRRNGQLASAATPRTQVPPAATVQPLPSSPAPTTVQRTPGAPVRVAQASPRPRTAQPQTVQPQAVQPQTIQRTPFQSAPVQPRPVQSQSVQAQSAQIQPVPTDPGQRALAQAQTIQPTSAPSASAQTQPAPATSRAPAQVQGPPAPGFDSLSGTPPTVTPVQSAAATPPAATSPAATPPPGAAEPGPSPTPAAPQVALAQASPLPATPAPNPEATRTLADIIRAIDVPESERTSSVAAVDLAEIQQMQAARRLEKQTAADKVKKAAVAKAKAEADAKAKAAAAEKARLAANPSRNWVQIATGANKGALGFTLKQLRAKYDDIAPQDAWIAAWGRTNRLVIGPFPSFARAQAIEKSLKAKGADVFAWKSDAGEDVAKVGG